MPEAYRSWLRRTARAIGLLVLFFAGLAVILIVAGRPNGLPPLAVLAVIPVALYVFMLMVTLPRARLRPPATAGDESSRPRAPDPVAVKHAFRRAIGVFLTFVGVVNVASALERGWPVGAAVAGAVTLGGVVLVVLAIRAQRRVRR